MRLLSTRVGAAGLLVLLAVQATLTNNLANNHHSPQVLQVIEKRLLTMLGMPTRPRPASPLSIPDYMIKLHQTQLRELSGKRTRKHHRPTVSLSGSANTIRSHQIQGMPNLFLSYIHILFITKIVH